MDSQSFENHIVDDIPVYLTDGLFPVDREAFEAHVAQCSACAAALEDARAIDESLREMFASANPGLDFENRVITRFRQKTTRRTVHPMVRRVAIGVAATLLMGSAGAFYQRNTGRFERVRAASNLKQIGLAMMMYSNGERNLGESDTFASAQHSFNADINILQPAARSFGRPVEGTESKANLYYYERDESGRGVTAQLDDASTPAPMLLGRNPVLKDAKISNGIISLSGTNSYTGGTTLNGGTLTIAGGGTLAMGNAVLTPQTSSGSGGGFGGKADASNVNGRLAGGRSYGIPAVQQNAGSHAAYWSGAHDSSWNATGGAAGRNWSSQAGVEPAQLSATPPASGSVPAQLYPSNLNYTVAGVSSSSSPPVAAIVTNGTVAGKPVESTLTQGVVNLNTASALALTPLYDGSNKTEAGLRAPATHWNAIIAGPTDGGDFYRPAATPTASSAVPLDSIDSVLLPSSDGGDDNKPAATPVASSTPAPAPVAPTTKVPDSIGASAQVPAQEKTPSLQVAAGDTNGEEAKKAPANQQVAADNPPGVPVAPPPSPQTAAVEAGIASRKIIREGELTFEVDSFDSTVMTIGKIVGEETGYVSTTDSDKLANGKVKGTVVLRVPPEHLDTLVLKLRGIGDLKSQKITAQDITKQYTDLESELRAAHVMEERLLDIVKNGKGAVKDLLEAEKQLGVWREKIEQVEGEIRYDNNLVSLSTLTITLMERDIKAAASTSITEQVTMSLETENVEQAYTATRDAIDSAKGRIVQSELKQFDAGQFGGTIKAQLPPDQADAVIARIRQMDGRIANFQRQRNQTNEGGSGAPLDAAKVKHEDVTLALTIYNLANIAPRRTTSLTIVAANVDDVYAAVLDQAAKAGARVVSSNLNHPRPDQSSGTISLSQTSDKTDALLVTLRANGEMLGQESTDNPDTQNVTAAKRGVVVQVISLAAVQARQSEALGIASTDVPAAFTGILDSLRATDARIIASQLNQQDPTNQTATIVFDISRAARPSVDATIDKVGEVFARNITRSQDTANTLDSKVHCELTLQSADVLPARQTTTLGVEVRDVQKSVEQLLTAASDMGGREIDKDISQDQNGRTVAHVIVEVPLSKADALGDQIEGWGNRRSKQVNHNTQAPQGKLARGRLEVTLADAATGLGGEETTWDALRNGLNVSGQGLRWSVQMLTIGACIVLPWIFVIWVGWKLLKRRKQRKAAVVVS
jgi:autotransporter-associated beta strand protein